MAFELERRGRARTVTGIAPAGGWTRWAPTKFEVIAKFVGGMPVWVLAHLLGPRLLRLPMSRRIGTLPISGSPDGISEDELLGVIDDLKHCPAYFQLLVKSLLMPGLVELAHTGVPTHLVLCEKDRVVPPHRFSGHFTDHLPAANEVTILDGVGHIPMFEAPSRVTAVVSNFLRQHSTPLRAVEDPPAS